MPALADAHQGTTGSLAQHTCCQVGDGGCLCVHKQQVLRGGRAQAAASPRGAGAMSLSPCAQGSPCGSAAGCPARLAGCQLPSTAAAPFQHRAPQRLQVGQSTGATGPWAPSMGGPSPMAVPSPAHHATLTLCGLLHHVEHRHRLPCLPGELGRPRGQGQAPSRETEAGRLRDKPTLPPLLGTVSGCDIPC